MKIILASTSKFKSDLLNQAHIPHICLKPNYEENSSNPNYLEYATELSLGKASSIKEIGIIIGIDTIVYCNNKIYEKPHDLNEVRNNLKELNNNINSVVTGITIIDKYQNKIISTYDETFVHIRKMTEEDINFYIENEKDALYASGYIIENTMSCYVDEIKGSYTNILGVPTNKILELLQSLGYNVNDFKNML